MKIVTFGFICVRKAVCSLSLLCVFLVLGTDSSFSQAPREDQTSDATGDYYQLPEIIIEGVPIEETVFRTPKNVSVITDMDIDMSAGEGITDLLSRQANVDPRGYFGNGKQTAVDIRGMGATSVSTVLVVVDGIRLNAPDLSGSDLSSVPLQEVKKIEIIRGAGSVVYGDGAVGGVINIVSKKGSEEPTTRVNATLGAYQTRDLGLSWSGRRGGLGINLYGNSHKTDGYRDNGFLRKGTVGARLEYDLTDSLTLSQQLISHRDQYGLPGPISKENKDVRHARTKTNSPNDHGETTDNRWITGLEYKEGDHRFKLLRGYRFRHNSYILGYSPLLSEEDQISQIDDESKTLNVIYSRGYGDARNRHMFRCGFDHYRSRYVREARASKDRKNSLVERAGVFMMNQWSMIERIKLNLGFRVHRTKGRFRTDERKSFGGVKRWINGDVTTREWRDRSYDIGVLYSLSDERTLFVNLATSFRTPNVDELALTDKDEALVPQHGEHVEVGAHFRGGAGALFTVTAFQMNIDNEIYWGRNPDTGVSVNRNYDFRTVRRGIEAQFRYYPLEELYIWGAFSRVVARFEGSGVSVPLVPDYKLNLGAEYSFYDALILTSSIAAVGERFDGNDEDNKSYDTLPPHQVVHLKLTYDRSDGKALYFGVNNALNALYSTIAYSESYYPMPERNYYGGIKWTF